MFRSFDRFFILAVFAAAGAAAQEDLTLPPRIVDVPGSASGVVATEVAATSSETLEEIVVTGDDNPWRLPDLGSAWREREESQEETGRIRAEVFPLWNPEAEQPAPDLSPISTEMQRVGFIEIFRIRFGGRD